jgi:hypothetical protein
MKFEQIARRVAANKPEPGEKEKIPEDAPKKEDINWTKLQSVYRTGLKPAFLDMGRAIKDQDNIEIFRLFGEIIDQLTLMARSTGQRNVMTRLKTIGEIFD